MVDNRQRGRFPSAPPPPDDDTKIEKISKKTFSDAFSFQQIHFNSLTINLLTDNVPQHNI